MARKRRSSRQHVSYARQEGGSYGDAFSPVRAKGGELAILREPRGAIREHPFAFILGAFAAGVVATLIVKSASTPTA